jgi:hypothetical protein
MGSNLETSHDNAWIFRSWWRDAIALTVLAGIHFFFLGKYGIYDWHNNDGQNYYELSQALRSSQTWVSVPDLHDYIPLSLLRLPLYPMLIIVAENVFGRFWAEAVVVAQMAAVLYANFILYRAATLFSRLWIVGIGAACLFALTLVSTFERYVLTDAFAFALFTLVICHVSTAVYEGRYLTKGQILALAAAFAALFLFREANPIFSLALAPLILAAVAPGLRTSAAARIFGPMLAVMLAIGLWNVYRVGSFVITVGSTLAPVLALYQADKIGGVLDQDHPIDRAIKEEMKQFDYSYVITINERLKKELSVQSPGLVPYTTKRYLSAWLNHPVTMVRYVASNWQAAKSAFVSVYIYDNAEIPPGTKNSYLWWSQQIMIFGMMFCPLAWVVGAAFRGLRRQAWIVGSLWAFSASVIFLYCALWFEMRYILPMLGAALLILALSCGAILRAVNVALRMTGVIQPIRVTSCFHHGAIVRANISSSTSVRGQWTKPLAR